MTQTFKIVLGSALVTAAALKALPALAQTAPAPVNVSVVHTSDLDLSSNAGRRQLAARLANAAREVCGVASDSDLVGKNQVRACRGDVIAKARADASPVLVAAAHGAFLADHPARLYAASQFRRAGPACNYPNSRRSASIAMAR